MKTFDESFEILIGHEGGYVNDPNDPGGETKYGISKRSYPHEDIACMTLERAKEIYKRDFWDRCCCDELPQELAFQVFDAAVNSGVRRAVRWLQNAVGVTSDGVCGAITLDAARAIDPYQAAARLNGYRLLFMCNLPTWKHFSRGWAKRIAENLLL